MGKHCSRHRHSVGNHKTAASPAKASVQIGALTANGAHKVKDRSKQEFATTKAVPDKIAEPTNADISVQS